MSKKRKIKLQRGKFYVLYPNGCHPSLIFKKNVRKNRYDAIVFGTTLGHHRIKLRYPIASNITISAVHSKPIRGVRSDFGDKEYKGLLVKKEDRAIIKTIKNKNPQETRKYREYKKTRQATLSSSTL